MSGKDGRQAGGSLLNLCTVRSQRFPTFIIYLNKTISVVIKKSEDVKIIVIK